MDSAQTIATFRRYLNAEYSQAVEGIQHHPGFAGLTWEDVTQYAVIELWAERYTEKDPLRRPKRPNIWQWAAVAGAIGAVLGLLAGIALA